MNLSYWEIKQWLTKVDFTIVGSGIVGLNCALSLQKKHPKAKILVLEKGVFPQGASTKNAGFACFGSISELLDDFNKHSEEEVVSLVKKRYEGLHFLRKTLGDKSIDYCNYGGYELFTKEDSLTYETCFENKKRINNLLKPYFKKNVFEEKKNSFGFKNIQDYYMFNSFEGQIDAGKMMDALLKKCLKNNIHILNSTSVVSFEDIDNSVMIKTLNFEFTSHKLLIATNGFASTLINENINPARAQVLITKPLKKLPIKGTFHLDKGYYYFRNINNRILLGGGRNLDFKGETTMEFGETTIIQNKLEELLKTVILPDNDFEIEQKWSGIMGLGNTKTPLLKQISNNVFCGVRMGGMGIAIGSLIGKDLANLV